MTAKIEIRSFKSLRALQGPQDEPLFLLAGRAVTYGALSAPIGHFRERVQAGAFTRSLANSSSDCRCLFNHSADHVLGRQKNGTLTLIDGCDGLDFRCQLDPNQQTHRDLYSSVQRGDIDACSFAFNVDNSDGDGDTFDTDVDERGQRFNRRTIKRANLFDCSIVTNPAYDATSVQARSFAVRLFPTRGPQGEILLPRLIMTTPSSKQTVDADLEAQKVKAHGQYQRIAADFRAAGMPTKAVDREAEAAKRRARAREILERIREVAEI